MKYQYVFEINAALSRAFTRSIQLSVGEGEVTVEEIASDIDSALDTWRTNVNCFRSDNSDRFTHGLPMPPEVRDLMFFLRYCYDYAKSRVKHDSEDSEGWSERLLGLAYAIMMVSSYYPDAEGESGDTAEKGKPFDAYVLCDDVAGFKVLFKSELTDENGKMKIGKAAAKVIEDAIRTRKLSKDVSMEKLVKEFGLNCSPQGINIYLDRNIK